MVFALVFAVLVHIVLYFLLEGFFKPRAYVVDQTSYRISLNARTDDAQVMPNPEPVVHIPANTSSPVRSRTKTEPVKTLGKTLEKKLPEPVKEVAKAEPKQTLKPELKSEVSQPPEKPNKKAAAKNVQQITSTEFKERRVNQPEPEANTQQAKSEKALSAGDAKPSEPASSEPTKQQVLAEQSQPKEAPTKESSKEPIEEPKPKLREPQFQIGSPNNPKPTYPQRAINRGWEGDVVLGVHVDADGTVTYVEILESSNVSALDFAAYSTVMDSWRFSPADEDERALRGYVTVPISFRIN